VLIVGELRNCDGVDCDHSVHHHTTGTAFMPYPATSGSYLLGALLTTPLLPRATLANACDVDDPVALHYALGNPDVIALGRAAHLRLADAGISHATVPHPQFVRRFHHRESERYGKLIESLVGTRENQLSWRP
jgi:hypothetical protein